MRLNGRIAFLAILALTGPCYAQDGQAPEKQGGQVYGPPIPEELKTKVQPAGEKPAGVPGVLFEAVNIAADTHPEVRVANAKRRARKSELKGAKWLSFPSLTVEGLALGGGNQNADPDGLTANLVLEQPIWAGGKIAGTIDRARAAWMASGNAISEAKLDVALRTIQAYFELALATKQEAILKDSLVQHNRLLDTIGHRVDQEVSPRADLELANSRAAQIEQDLAAAQGRRATSYSQLMELVGYVQLDLGNVPSFDRSAILPKEEELIAQALVCSPKIARLRDERLMAEAERKVAKGSVFPQVVAQVSTNEITGTRAGLALRLQTGNGLSQFSAIGTADAEIQAADFEIATAEREIREQVVLDMLSYKTASQRIFSGARATQSSRLVTESYERQFIAGRRTWLDVMNAVRESMSSQLSEAEAEVSAMASASRMLLRSCAWSLPGSGQATEDR